MIQYIIIDVDGVMTDSGIYYDDSGNELKKFTTRDAAGFFALREAGIKVIVLTGRECPATVKRMKDLHVENLYQGVTDKKEWICRFAAENGVAKNEIGYIGDDLNDLGAMHTSGFTACPADSCSEVMSIADYVSSKNGGQGVVRDVAEYLLRKTGAWDKIIKNLYHSGI